MGKCKSTICESDSLKNSLYCFKHYRKPEPPPTTALMCREKLVKPRVRAVGSRLSVAGTSGVAIGMAYLQSGQRDMPDYARFFKDKMFSLALVSMTESIRRAGKGKSDGK